MTEARIGCDWLELLVHLESKFKPGMTRENYGPVWHVDHIIPLASAKTEDEIIKLCHYSNLQSLFALENFQKGAKINFTSFK